MLRDGGGGGLLGRVGLAALLPSCWCWCSCSCSFRGRSAWGLADRLMGLSVDAISILHLRTHLQHTQAVGQSQEEREAALLLLLLSCAGSTPDVQDAAAAADPGVTNCHHTATPDSAAPGVRRRLSHTADRPRGASQRGPRAQHPAAQGCVRAPRLDEWMPIKIKAADMYKRIALQSTPGKRASPVNLLAVAPGTEEDVAALYIYDMSGALLARHATGHAAAVTCIAFDGAAAGTGNGASLRQ